MDSITTRKDAWPVFDDESDLLDLMFANASVRRPRTRIGVDTPPANKTTAIVPVVGPASTLGHLGAAFDTLSPVAKAGVVLGVIVLASVALGWLVGASAKAAAVSVVAL